ncbi:uncharacterized protein LOC130635770 [Hydractinia symbiolongicarpus]|uniref:uncharacterized protein LOC130635770 n=1 Tax=Hydractinia symbiolongicarpus TaxID=13093 RepID=UPI00254ABBEE|nr:uncharacterized protein LOC130635770 [Hydractinia symbiolongicarpus]
MTFLRKVMNTNSNECPFLTNLYAESIATELFQQGTGHLVTDSSQGTNQYSLSQIGHTSIPTKEQSCSTFYNPWGSCTPNNGFVTYHPESNSNTYEENSWSQFYMSELEPLTKTQDNYFPDAKKKKVTDPVENMSRPLESNSLFEDNSLQTLNYISGTTQSTNPQLSNQQPNYISLDEPKQFVLGSQLTSLNEASELAENNVMNVSQDFTSYADMLEFDETSPVVQDINFAVTPEMSDFIALKEQEIMCEYTAYHNTGNQSVPTDRDGDTQLLLHILNRRTEQAIEDIRTKKLKLCSNCFANYLNVINNKQQAALHMACYNQNAAVIIELLKHDIDVTLMDSESNTVFNIIIDRAKTEDFALQLLARFLDQNVVMRYQEDFKTAFGKRNNEGRGAMHLAVKKNFRHVVSAIVRAGADINLQETQAKRTSLVIAAKHGDWKMVKFLVHLGACINLAPRSNVRAIHYACMQNNVDAVKFLIEKCVDLNQRTCEGKREKELTKSKEIEQIISEEMKRRRRTRTKANKDKDKAGNQRSCRCGSGQSVT